MNAVVLGGGIAGLTVGIALARSGVETTIVEAAPNPGGLAYGFRQDGYSFDLFSHRLWSRDVEVIARITAWVGAPLLERRKVSRILLDGRFYNYPIDLRDLLSGGSSRVALRALAGYASARLQRGPRGDDFRSYMTACYGAALFETFFGPYTEKLTGCGAAELSVDLAKDAIPDTGLVRQLLHRMIGRVDPWDDFLYPAGGFMTLADGMARDFAASGGRLMLEHRVERLARGRAERLRTIEVRGPSGVERLETDLVVSTIPLGSLLAGLDPPAPAAARAAADALRTRAMVAVYLGIRRERITDDHWIYVPDPAIRFNRLSETTNYSEAMAPPGRTGLCAEIACERGDEIWRQEPADQIERVIADLLRLGLLGSRDEVERSWMRRAPSAYPVYRVGYERHLAIVEAELARFPNLHLCGRQGAFWYGSTAQGIRQGLDLVRDLDLGAARAA